MSYEKYFMRTFNHTLFIGRLCYYRLYLDDIFIASTDGEFSTNSVYYILHEHGFYTLFLTIERVAVSYHEKFKLQYRK